MNPWSVPIEQLEKMAFQQAPKAPPSPLAQAFTEFRQACPDFAPTQENMQALANYCRTPNPNADDLIVAHALASYENRYQPVTVKPQDTNPATMDLSQLRDVVNQVPEAPNEYAMDMGELRKAAFGEEPAANEYSMPLEQLQAAAFTPERTEQNGNSN